MSSHDIIEKFDTLRNNYNRAGHTHHFMRSLWADAVRHNICITENTMQQLISKIRAGRQGGFRDPSVSASGAFVEWLISLDNEYMVPYVAMSSLPSLQPPTSIKPKIQSNRDSSLDYRIITPFVDAWKQVNSYFVVDYITTVLSELGFNREAFISLSNLANGPDQT